MAQLMEMIKGRQGQMSPEEYANKIGIRGATLYRYYQGNREISISVLRKMAEFYRHQGDTEMVNALACYAVGAMPVTSSSN